MEGYIVDGLRVLVLAAEESLDGSGKARIALRGFKGLT
jgi:hypothetical protein